MSDEELYEAGRAVWASMGRPRSQNRFLDALKAAGIPGATARKRDLHKRLVAETVADATDVIGLDVDADELAD